MKKHLLLSILLFFCLITFAQNKTIKVAVVVNTDTVFSVLGPYSVKTFDINLPKELFGYINQMIDTSVFKLQEEVLPYQIAADSKQNIGFPKKNSRKKWLTELRKTKGYDMVVFLFTPQITHPTYRKLNGLAYGMSSSKNLVFSLNDAYIWDTRDAEDLAHVSLYTDSEFVTHIDPGKWYKKALRDYTPVDVQMVQPLIQNLNMEFALRTCQNMMIAKKAFEKKQ
jgi:hypothetical protein